VEKLSVAEVQRDSGFQIVLTSLIIDLVAARLLHFNPHLLTWAREQSGYARGPVAKRLNVKPERRSPGSAVK